MANFYTGSDLIIKKGVRHHKLIFDAFRRFMKILGLSEALIENEIIFLSNAESFSKSRKTIGELS